MRFYRCKNSSDEFLSVKDGLEYVVQWCHARHTCLFVIRHEWHPFHVVSYKSFSLSNVVRYIRLGIETRIEQEMTRTSVKAFLSATLALCRRRITFLAPSTTAASIRRRCRSSSTLSSSASSRLGSYLSGIVIVHVLSIVFETIRSVSSKKKSNRKNLTNQRRVEHRFITVRTRLFRGAEKSKAHRR